MALAGVCFLSVWSRVGLVATLSDNCYISCCVSKVTTVPRFKREKIYREKFCGQICAEVTFKVELVSTGIHKEMADCKCYPTLQKK